jgi:LPS sulfotransferase NodH
MWLRYLTNGPEFDFPLFAGPPPVRYVLASTPRSGSNMLARALWHTGVAGFAEDYFADEYVLDYFERWGFAAGDQESMIECYVRKLMTVRTSPNGVFGVKVHARQLPHLEIDLHDLLLSPRYIWIQRRDRLRQAISYSLAEQTGAWILDGTYLPLRERVAEPRYSYADIRRHLLLLDRDVAAWEEYFDRRNLNPHVVVYEDLGRPGFFGGPCLPNMINLPFFPAACSSFPHILSEECTCRRSAAAQCYTSQPIPGSRA